jgi:hypothetical protein
MPETPSPEQVVAETRAWIEQAVIGLDLCPFAKVPYAKKQVRYAVSAAETPHELLAHLAEELERLSAADPEEIETTLLIHPWVLADFLDHNDFLEVAEAAVEELGFSGEIQVASFHPRYQFAGTAPDDPENGTNRSPYPTLHLLREASVERAVAAFGDTSIIYEKNIETLRRLGREGWERLERAWRAARP